MASGDKQPFQTMSFMLADAQAEMIKDALARAKANEMFDVMDKHGNENGNGNAIAMIVQQWMEEQGCQAAE